MIPILVILSLLGVMYTTIWYYRTLCRRNRNKTIVAGFAASVSQWLLFWTIGFTPLRSMLYTSVIFMVMILFWLSAEWAQSTAQGKSWTPSNAFWVYFLGTIIGCISLGQAMI